ncbi:Thioredoxin and Glutaredoxin domain containing protein [Aphelenchoides bicaudatus]|nr:Thioredoxin and Glutaredoxin domain containing protein [Aphelenchoides bicaudatus]
MAIQTLTDKSGFDEFISQPGLRILHFGASWAPSSVELNELLADLKKEFKEEIHPAYIDAEELSDISLENKVEAAPTTIFFKEGKEIHRLAGYHPTDLRNAIISQTFNKDGVAAGQAPVVPPPKKDLNTRLKELINKARVTLFMKGNPEVPKCGFSRQIVQMLTELNVDFWTFDILSDEEVRQGLKVYSDWPTYPQVYLDGELLGGLDVIREEIKDPEFVAKLPKAK